LLTRLLVWPSWIEILAVMACLISVLKFLLPFGRPLAFPDVPGLNLDAKGGRP
jgi:hypothetical protein